MRAGPQGPAGRGIPVENSKGEWGPGQEEINVRYADALEMADRHAILKNGVKEIALRARQGRHRSWRSGTSA
jgi:glutamine synthetase